MVHLKGRPVPIATAMDTGAWPGKHMAFGKVKKGPTGGKDKGVRGVRADRLDTAVVAAELADTTRACGVPQVHALIARSSQHPFIILRMPMLF